MRELSQKVSTPIELLTSSAPPALAPTEALESQTRNGFWQYDLACGQSSKPELAGRYEQIIKRSGIVGMFAEMLRFANELEHRESNPRWLTILGTSGAGKTHLCWRLMEFYLDTARRAGDRGRSGLKPWPEMESDLRGGKHWLLNAISKDFLVILDDVGAGYDTAFSVSKLYELLNNRLGKWTVITSNLSLSALAEMDRRIASRIAGPENRVVELDPQTVPYALWEPEKGREGS
jgi:hypothetical protein